MDNQGVSGIVSDYSMVIVLGLGMLLGFIYWIHNTMKKNPNLTFGDIVNAKIVTEKVSIFILGCFLINFSEALMAASIHPVGQVPPNALARIVGHMIIAMAGITSGLSMPDLFRALISPKTKNRGGALFLFILSFVGTFGFPYANLVIISSGLKEMQLMNIFIYSLVPWNNMVDYYSSVGLPATFAPLEHMSYVMLTSIIMTIAHYFLVIFDGTHMIYSDKTTLNIKFDQKDGKKDTKDDDKSSKKESYDPIPRLIQRYFNNTVEESVEKHWATKAHSIHDTMNMSDKSRLSSSISSIIYKIKDFDKRSGSMSSKDKSSGKIELRKEIFELFKASTNQGKGFGITLPKIDLDKGND